MNQTVHLQMKIINTTENSYIDVEEAVSVEHIQHWEQIRIYSHVKSLKSLESHQTLDAGPI